MTRSTPASIQTERKRIWKDGDTVTLSHFWGSWRKRACGSKSRRSPGGSAAGRAGRHGLLQHGPLQGQGSVRRHRDRHGTIVAAVEQGRVIYDNIRKLIKYLLTSNSAEILVMLVGPLLGMPLPLLPLQILWINLVTDRLRQGHGATTSWRWRPSRRNFDREPVGIYLTAPHPE